MDPYRPATGDAVTAAPTAAKEHYHREKARRAGRERPHDHPLEQARRAYEELLASDAAKAKGGRPRKSAPGTVNRPPIPADDDGEET